MRISDWSSDVCSSDLIGKYRLTTREQRNEHARNRIQRRAKRRDLGPRRVGRIAAVKQEEGQRRIGLRVLLEIAVEIIKAADDVQPVGLISQLQFLREIIIILLRGAMQDGRLRHVKVDRACGIEFAIDRKSTRLNSSH